VSEVGRGIFDGENPPSTTFIFDPNIFDTQLTLPVAQVPVNAFVHGNERQEAMIHGNERIPRSVG